MLRLWPRPISPPAAVEVEVSRAPAPGPAPEEWSGFRAEPSGWAAGDMRLAGCPSNAPVTIDEYWIDKSPVLFVRISNSSKIESYGTVAEKDQIQGLSQGSGKMCLCPAVRSSPRPIISVPLDNHLQWWRYVPGANWMHQKDQKAASRARENHPVVHIAGEDAAAYAKWARKHSHGSRI
ncbi:MAG: SUMF1/EgtB/PvdO family nonheme iron enzyme [Acidobacteria bacterium]|nr:SUMF1/EgtB/PvdO family nonheme iron enzyme [Acidobacteriota bacterium]